MLLLAGIVIAGEVKFPDHNGYVNDFAGVLSPDTVKTLDGVCRSLEQKTSAELAIAVVKSVAPLDSKEYAVKLFEKWKIGKKGKDNGILLLVAIDERRVEIEVGYGLEGTITDATAGRILDEFVVPYFKQGQMDAGVIGGAKAIAAKISGSGTDELEKEKAAQLQEKGEGPMVFIYIIGGVVAAMALLVISAKYSGRLAVWIFGLLFGGFMGAVFGEWTGAMIGGAIGFVIFFALSFLPPGSGEGGGFSGGSGGGGSSDFGGGSSSDSESFGGGSSGGGGAGRSW